MPQSAPPPAIHAPAPHGALRVSYAFVQHLVAPPLTVMPFLTATGERAWARDWDPVVLHPAEGAEGEGAVFLTAGPHHPSTIWVCTDFTAPLAGAPGRITYAHVTPGRDVTTVHITLEAEGTGTRATIRYAWTSLSPAGDAFVAHHTRDDFDASMREWERDLNAALHKASRSPTNSR